MIYLDVADVPLDAYSLPDVGDEHPVGHETLDRVLLAAVIKKKKPQFVIPYTRPLTEGDVGRDVEGAKRMIWRANGLHVSDHFTPDFGPIAKQQLEVFQKKARIAPDGVLGPATLKKLAPFADRYAFLLYTGFPPGGTKEEQVRRAIVAYCLWGYNSRQDIHYAELRPMSYMGDLERLPIWEDCSTFATKAYDFGGAPDPNGLHYDGSGNTGTMRAHGVVLPDWHSALPGDLAHYDGPQHVAVCVGAGRAVSLGSEIGPLLVPITYRPLTYVRRYDLALAA